MEDHHLLRISDGGSRPRTTGANNGCSIGRTLNAAGPEDSIARLKARQLGVGVTIRTSGILAHGRGPTNESCVESGFTGAAQYRQRQSLTKAVVDVRMSEAT